MSTRNVSLRLLRQICRQTLHGAGILALAACSPSTQPEPVIVGVGTTSGGGSTDGPIGDGPTGGGGKEKPRDCRVGETQGHGCAGFFVELASSFADCDIPGEGPLPAERCGQFCGEHEVTCEAFDRDGTPAVSCNTTSTEPCLGRRPAGSRRDRPGACGVAAYLGRARRLEARSVDAFEELARELGRWDAPVGLIRACHRAAADEARHAAAMTDLLRRRGRRARPLLARRARGFGSLEALARHNEREGVVGETWAALLAAHQAEHASDPHVRRAMRAIAREELQHAALSFRIARWARRRLGPVAAHRLDSTRHGAFERIRTGIGEFPGQDPSNALGWPSPETARALAEGLASLFVLPVDAAEWQHTS